MVKVMLWGLRSNLYNLDISENIGTVNVTDAIGDTKMRDEFEVMATINGSRTRDDDITLLEAERVRIRLTKND